jgi:protein SCO1/2
MGPRNRQLTHPSRRRFLMGLGAASFGISLPSSAHNDAGAVSPPLAPPALSLDLHDGSSSSLQALLSGRVSAVQLMFTSCQATCPIQGALFADAAKRLGERLQPAQLLSISIDPERDSPAVLRDWLKRFGGSPRWRAARPQKAQLENLVGFLKSKNPAPDPHTAQVYFFDRKGLLVLRSVDFPPGKEVVRVLEQLA